MISQGTQNPARRWLSTWWGRWRHEPDLRRLVLGLLLCSGLLLLLILLLTSR